MKVLFDTNVVLDVILDRQPFREASAQIFNRVERGEIIGVLGATTLTTIYYLTTKTTGEKEARSIVRDLIELFEIAAVDRDMLGRAVDSPTDDFEDAVLFEAGLAVSVDAVVTRDPDDFPANSLPVMSPQQFESSLESSGS